MIGIFSTGTHKKALKEEDAKSRRVDLCLKILIKLENHSKIQNFGKKQS